MNKILIILLLTTIFISNCKPNVKYDSIIRNALVYDGTGKDPVNADIGISGDTIAFIGDLSEAIATTEIEANGLAVSPGFINMLSWATVSLIEDGRSQGDIRQGVTLEVFGEGFSYGPLNDEMKAQMIRDQGDIKFDIKWTTLGEYLDYLVNKGISCNIASFMGATTIRIHELGYENRPPNTDELERMKDLVRQGMEEGALGIGSSLIYAPAFYASTDELIALCKVASEYGGMYISHMRSEGDYLLEGINELMKISKEGDLPAEIYHLKAAGQDNWYKMDLALAKIDSARAAGLKITADMYTYIAGATGLDASMPPWVQVGGYDAWAARLKDPKIREQLKEEISKKGDGWENLYYAAGSPENILLIGFKEDSLKYLQGKTLKEVAEIRKEDPISTMMDLVIDDGARVETVYFLMTEDNLKKQIAKDYVSFCSDTESSSPEGNFLKSSTHPRAYGNFARLLAKYVREEKVITLQEAIRRLTSLPAENLKLKKRGLLKPGYYADVVIFDPTKVQDHATFKNPFQFSTGVRDVFVNGVLVLRNGEHTGKFPGQVVRGPGWKGN